MYDQCIDHGQRGDRDGYGFAHFGGKTSGAHRVAFAIANGVAMEQIKGLIVRHNCDNPRCVNPSHLLIGTVADNRKDCFKRGRTEAVPKLTDKEVLEIRDCCAPGARGRGMSYRALGRKLGIDSSAVRKVFLGMTYKDVSASKVEESRAAHG